MIIEVTLDGRGQVRVEADYTISVKQTKGLIDHATAALYAASDGKRQPIGFGAGSSTHLDHGPGSEADPTEAGWVVR